MKEFTYLVFYITGLNSTPIFAGFSCVIFPHDLPAQVFHVIKSSAFCTQIIKQWEVLFYVYGTYWSAQLIRFLYHDVGHCAMLHVERGTVDGLQACSQTAEGT